MCFLACGTNWNQFFERVLLLRNSEPGRKLLSVTIRDLGNSQAPWPS